MAKIESNTLSLHKEKVDLSELIENVMKAFQFDGPKPSLNHITAVSRYFSRLPYENISKIIKHGQKDSSSPFRLPDELTEEHYTWHLGGTCFSLTYFLSGIYTLLGYRVQPLLCHLNWGKNTHSAVVIQFDNIRYLVDPGYMIFKPIPLRKENVESVLSSETGLSLRFDPNLDEYALYTYRKKQLVRRYRFLDKAVNWDQFAKCWQASFELPGMDNLTLTRVHGTEMIFIQGDFIKITTPTQIEKVREWNQAEKLIKDRFGIPLEKVAEAQCILQISGKKGNNEN